MIKPSIIITGANGFIGERLVHYFFENGWRVKAFVRTVPKEIIRDVEYVEYDLEQELNPSNFESVDYLVHCAYSKFEKGNNANEINYAGTSRIISMCRDMNVKPLFLSSFSAHKDAESNYGKAKLACEKIVDLTTDIILKPGFVIGKKGLSGELINRIRKSAFFPLVGGKQPIQTIYIDDLCLSIQLLLEKELTGVFYVAEEEAISMGVFYKEIAKQLNKKIKFVPVSISLLLIACKFFEAMKIKLPVTSENVLGLKQLKKFDTQKDLTAIGITLKNYKQSLQWTLSEDIA